MRALQLLGVPYTDQQIEDAAAAVANISEGDALIAYLQTLGTDMKGPAAAAGGVQ